MEATDWDPVPDSTPAVCELRTTDLPGLQILQVTGLEINFVENWPIGHLSQILTGQTISFTGHMQEQLNFNDKCFY